VHILQDGALVVAIADMDLEGGASYTDGVEGAAISKYDLSRRS
jgi:hypothetical protein